MISSLISSGDLKAILQNGMHLRASRLYRKIWTVHSVKVLHFLNAGQYPCCHVKQRAQEYHRYSHSEYKPHNAACGDGCEVFAQTLFWLLLFSDCHSVNRNSSEYLQDTVLPVPNQSAESQKDSIQSIVLRQGALTYNPSVVRLWRDAEPLGKRLQERARICHWPGIVQS